jgi:hypothetical protein
VGYTYEYEEKLYRGTDSKPFLSSTFAKDYLESFQVPETVVVKVNPERPERSVLRK